MFSLEYCRAVVSRLTTGAMIESGAVTISLIIGPHTGEAGSISEPSILN